MTGTRICALDDLVDGQARRFDLGSAAIAVVRLGDEVHAIGDRCSHANYSLSEGEVWPEERKLECPKHASSFSLVTGEPDTLPATRPVAVHTVTVDGDDVVVELA